MGLIAYERDKSVDGEYSIGPLTPSSADGEDGEEWLVFTLAKRGGNHQTAGTVKAPDAATAISRATAAFANGKVCNIPRRSRQSSARDNRTKNGHPGEHMT